jgi:aspartate aminotransferase
MLSQKAKNLKPSPTLALAAKAKDLQKKGLDVVSLAVGEPDWATFEVAEKAGIEAIQKGYTKYTATAGILELRNAVVKNLKDVSGLSYSANEIVISSGAKFVLFAALNMLCDANDEVIIPAPYWVSYPTMVDLAGGKNVLVTTKKENNFKLTAKELEASITPKTKALILCSPSNPTGIIYSKTELAALAEVLKKNPHVFIISDDIYNRLIFTNQDIKVAPHILDVAPELKARTLVVNGASKSYSMTGWRIGWGAGPADLIQAMVDYQSQSTSNASSISQWAAVAAIESGEAELQKSLGELKVRRDHAVKRIAEMPKLDLANPEGAFYLWLGVDQLFGTHCNGTPVTNSKAVSEILLDQYLVSTVPGVEFGFEGYIRLSYVVSMTELNKALDRLQKFASKCKAL